MQGVIRVIHFCQQKAVGNWAGIEMPGPPS